MKYVDAGYAICLGVLFFYCCALLVRRRRLARAVAVLDDPAAALPASPSPPAHEALGGSSLAGSDLDRPAPGAAR